MLTLPDFKEKKIVFVSSGGDEPNDLRFGNGNVKLYRYGEFVNQISCHLVFSLFIVGETTITSVLIKNAQKYGISIFLLNKSFKPYAQIMSKADGNYRIRQTQYKYTLKQNLELSKSLILNKIENQIAISKKYKHKIIITGLQSKVYSVKNRQQLLGVEGSASSKYFSAIFSDLGWYRRAPRTKEDIPNLMLDIGYTFLFNYVDSLLLLFGFDTFKGFYHQLFFQRKSLSCDIMEPMRPIIDAQLIKSYHLNQLIKKDFKYINGSFKFKPKQSKKYIDIWFQLIMKNRVEVYNYVLGFYRHLLNPEKYLFPKFKI